MSNDITQPLPVFRPRRSTAAPVMMPFARDIAASRAVTQPLPVFDLATELARWER
jgi:hypothetical protein